MPGDLRRFQERRQRKNDHAIFQDNTVDSRILASAFELQRAQPKTPAILVSKDINLRLKADALGLQAEDYESDRVLLTDLYTGMVERMASPEKIAAYVRMSLGRRLAVAEGLYWTARKMKAAGLRRQPESLTTCVRLHQKGEAERGSPVYVGLAHTPWGTPQGVKS